MNGPGFNRSHETLADNAVGFSECGSSSGLAGPNVQVSREQGLSRASKGRDSRGGHGGRPMTPIGAAPVEVLRDPP